MKKLMVFFVVFVLPSAAYAHPGKTDKYGGHQCLKGCEEWKLYYKEYHLHDKYGRPIRVSRKKAGQAELETAASRTLPAVEEQPLQTTQTVTVYRYVTTIKEENAYPFNPLLWVLLVLLLLLLILRLQRKRRDPER